MIDSSAIREHMEVIGADGIHIGTVDRLEGNRIQVDEGGQWPRQTPATITISRQPSSRRSRAIRCGCQPTRMLPSLSKKKRMVGIELRI